METKKENHKNTGYETPKKTEETVFELAPAKKENKFNDNKKFSAGFLAGFLAMALLATGIVYLKISPFVKGSVTNPVSLEEAKAKAEMYINYYNETYGQQITVKNAEENNNISKDLYKINLNGGTQEFESYISKDGKTYFTNAVDLKKIEDLVKNSAPLKSDKPQVELFVMSHCPFGTQIEKGILPVVDAMGDKISFDLKFTGFAMHGEKELKEELNQYCIKTEEPAKYNSYLKCFIESAGGDSAGCIAKTDIDKTKINSCVSATDKKFSVMKKFADQNSWGGSYPPFDIYKEDNAKYGVQGSPTLIINGKTVKSNRDSASLLKNICSAFNTVPKECETTLSAETPAPGFGTGTTAGNHDASCGS